MKKKSRVTPRGFGLDKRVECVLLGRLGKERVAEGKSRALSRTCEV